MLDINAWIEQFIKGVVFAIYNAIYSVALLLRSPLRGPLRLWSRWRAKPVQQLGPHSLLLICSFLLAAVVIQQNAVGDVVRGVLGAGRADYGSVWRLTLDGLLTFIVLDLLLRLLRAVDRQPGSRRRRDRSFSLTVYFTCSLMVVFTAAGYILKSFIYWLALYENPDWMTARYRWLNDLVFWVFFEETWFIFAVVIGVMLAALVWWWKVIRDVPVVPKTYASRSLALFVLILLASTSFGGRADLVGRAEDYVGTYIQKRVYTRGVKSPYLACTFEPDGGLAVYAMLFNDTDGPLAVKTSSFEVIFTRGVPISQWRQLPRTSTASYRATSSQAELPKLLILEKGAIQVIELRYQRSPELARIMRTLADWKAEFGQEDLIAVLGNPFFCLLQYRQIDPARASEGPAVQELESQVNLDGQSLGEVTIRLTEERQQDDA